MKVTEDGSCIPQPSLPRIKSATYHSIVYRNSENSIQKERVKSDPVYSDLNLDQIIGSVTSGKEEYLLTSLYYTPLRDIETVIYRQNIFRDFEDKRLLRAVTSFSEEMSTMRRYIHLADTLKYLYHKEGWFLAALDVYCTAVARLDGDLSHIDLQSEGLRSFRGYLHAYTNSSGFKKLLAETENLEEEFSTVEYCVLLKRNGCSVKKYENEIDYSDEVEKIFKKFNQGVEKEYGIKLQKSTGMNYVEAKILELVARLYPGKFSKLDSYYTENTGFADKKIEEFNREVQFYTAYLEYISMAKQTGLNFCYPEVSADKKSIYADATFDLALAYKLAGKNDSIVCNDFFLKDEERIIVVSGPNQGGKTTFARTFGQLHYLASLGCPVPGRRAGLYLYDRIFTHFERQENIKNLRGKLQDELVRMNNIFKNANSDSIIIMNEIFTSTTLKDGLFLSREIMKKIIQLDALCVLVTFMDELSLLSRKTVSMVSTVVPENPALRTYKIVRKPADGLAYAQSIAEKYRLTYPLLKERIHS